MKNLFSVHRQDLERSVHEILAELKYDQLVIHAGTPAFYHADDQEIPFHTVPHFRHWSPLEGPNHFLLIAPGEKTELIAVCPDDFWYEQARVGTPFWIEEYTITEVGNAKTAWDVLRERTAHKNTAFVGDEQGAGMAPAHGIAAHNRNPQALLSKLDELRTRKSGYEVACIRESNKIAAAGHARAYDAFMAHGSELDIHHAYLIGTKQAEVNLPYPAISALDEHGAVLHYQHKQEKRDGGICLLDAGTSFLGYASDVTRTWAAPKADGRFVSIINALNVLQQELCARVTPGVHTLELHYEAHKGIARILKAHDILYCEGDEAIRAGLPQAFFPHGLGHFLGIQVHDVGASNSENDNQKLAELFPKLRTIRTLEAGNVITIEPGIYFIPMLLKKLKESMSSHLVNWDLVQALTPCGGVRIEDDILVTKEGPQNLTRPYFESLDR